jgi:diaminopimelate epimerase
MTSINAYKMDGLGNDFIIVDRRKKPINLTKEKIIELGSRSNVGFDQLIFIEKEKENCFPITIFNSDGGEVSACGNGSRCVAYLLGKNLNTKEIKLKKKNRLLNAKIV